MILFCSRKNKIRTNTDKIFNVLFLKENYSFSMFSFSQKKENTDGEYCVAG